jgi:MFS family permease
MLIWQRMKPLIFRRVMSEQRKWLQIAVVEGIPATIIGNLLGGPILTAYLLYLGGNAEQVGLVMAIPPLANLAQILTAIYMQRIENRKLFMALFGTVHRFLWVATGLIPFLFPGDLQVPVFVAMYLLSFLSAQTCAVFWSSIIGDMVPPQVRGRYFGIRNTIHWAFASLSLLIGGQILQHFDEKHGFVIIYAASAVFMVWNAWELWRYPHLPFEKSAEASSAGRLLKPFKDRSFMTATLFLALFILVQNISVPLFSYVMLKTLQMSYWWVTVITTVQMIVMMISYYYWGNLNARFATKTLIMWSLPIIALSCLLWVGLAALPVLVVLIPVHILLGIGIGGYTMLAFNFMIGDTPKSDRPMYIAIFSALTGLTGFIGPLIGGTFYKWAQDGPFWIQSYGISFFTGIVLLILAAGAGPFVLRGTRSQ